MSSRAQRGFAALLSGVLAAGALTVAVAEPRSAAAASGVGANLGDGTVNTYVDRQRGRSKRPKRGHRPKPVLPALQYLTLPDCADNSPASNPAESCAEAAAACPTGQLRVRVFEAPLGTALGADDWKATAARCVRTYDAHLGEVVVPQLTGSQLRKFPIPAGTSMVEPAGGYAVVRLPTNLYSTTPEETTIRTTVLGLAVVIRVHPRSYRWDVGDGTILGPTADPGGPGVDAVHTHAYTKRGTYQIVLTTTYTAEYSVNGGAFQTISGETDVTSQPITVDVLGGKAELRAATN